MSEPFTQMDYRDVFHVDLQNDLSDMGTFVHI